MGRNEGREKTSIRRESEKKGGGSAGAREGREGVGNA